MQSMVRQWMKMPFTEMLIMGTPLWMWLGFLAIVLFLLVLDLGVLNKTQKEITIANSFKMSAFYILIGLGFGLLVWQNLGANSAVLYLTGFIVEKTLAIDNVFVIAMIFSYFAVPKQLQYRVLFYGILGVIILRGIMIGFGSAIVEQYHWVLYIFAAFLVFTGIKMLMPNGHDNDISNNVMLKWVQKIIPVSKDFDGQKFFTKVEIGGKLKTIATPLFLALIMVEIADLIFAIDSIPAIFAITTDPFIVFTSNIFAILGLRALYFALAAMVDRFKYLKYSLAILLIFIGSKIFIADLLGLEKFPPMLSLGATFTILAIGILYSLYKTKPKTI